MDRNNSKHTPGPWVADGVEWVDSPEGGHRWERVTAPQGWTVALVQADGDDAEMRANVALIAAAPELLAALREFLDAYERGEFFDDAASLARAAIARAEGASPDEAEGRA